MAGILDFLGLGGTPASGGILSSAPGAPIYPQQPPSSVAPSPPLPGSNWKSGLGLFGATLRDAGASLSGRPEDANNIAGFQTNARQQALLSAAAQARQAIANANGDPAATKQALMNYALLGGDSGTLLSLMKSENPDVKGYSVDQNVFATDPITGQRTQLQAGIRKPITSGGMQSTDNGQNWAPIPGYVANAGNVSGARRDAIVSRPMPGKAKAPGAIAIPHPSGLY